MPFRFWLVAPTRTKGSALLLARLVVGLRTKAIFSPGSKDYRDKWTESKTYCVVVDRARRSSAKSDDEGRGDLKKAQLLV